MKNQYNVVHLDILTPLDINPNNVLIEAVNKGMESVVVIGFTKDGDEYFASSQADGANVLWHLQRAQTKLLRRVDDK